MTPYGKAGENGAKRPPNYALRLQPSLMAEARRVAQSERISLNRFINTCVAEKLSALRTEGYFQEGLRRVECAMALRILDRWETLKSPAGTGESRWSGLHAPREQLTARLQPAPNPEGAGESTAPSGRAAPQFGRLKRQLDKTRGR